VDEVGKRSRPDLPGDEAAGGQPPVARDAPSTPELSGLQDALERWSTEREALLAGAGAGLPGRADWPELPALQEFRGLWAQLRNREQVRRALAPAPADAGPLNSRALVHRMLRLMQEQSPGYLRHFTAYIDMLTALQQLQDGSAAAGSSAGAGGAAAPARKRAKARKGRGAVQPPADRPPAKPD